MSSEIIPAENIDTIAAAAYTSKLWTQANRERIIQALEAGATLNLAAYAAGISVSLFRNWMKIGVIDIEDGIDSEFAVFARDVRLAQWDIAERMLNFIAADAAEDWRAAAWILERRFPREYGRQVLEISGNELEPVKIKAQLSMVEVVRTIEAGSVESDTGDE